MIIVRPINRKDMQIFAEMTFDSILGMTNLPRDRDKLYDKVLASEEAIQKNIQKPGQEEYLFVLEDLLTGRIGGTSGILANRSSALSHFYHIESIKTGAHHSSIPKEMRVLKAEQAQEQASEICCLYLQPSFRHSGQGRLLSLSRFLFMATFRERFEKKIVAEMRGFINQRQISPFWNAVGRHFCDLSFVELMAQIEQDRTFVKEMIPKFPIYIALLPQEAQEVIGKTHENTKPALNMLLSEGFTYNQYIDVFDGGPNLMATTSQIRTIKNSFLIKVETTSELLQEEPEFILSNSRIDFRACYGHLQVNKNKALINKDVAEGLRIRNGDTIRYVTIH